MRVTSYQQAVELARPYLGAGDDEPLSVVAESSTAYLIDVENKPLELGPCIVFKADGRVDLPSANFAGVSR